VLLSFAQFEREVIGERIRDKIAASKKKKGMWMGGVPPLGYGVQDHKLVMIDSEADAVRLDFPPLCRTRLSSLVNVGARSARDQK
jgi:DNA invertase Pin-like site-specific DNA recombinase